MESMDQEDHYKPSIQFQNNFENACCISLVDTSEKIC